MKKRLNILFQCDNNFAFMAGVAFTSLLMNASEKIDYYVYVLTPDMSCENKRNYFALVEEYSNISVKLEFISSAECEKEVASWNVPSHRGSWVTYYKLFVARLFPEDSGVERIIHIGADTLITGSLEGLVDFDFKGQPFAMNWSEKTHQHDYPIKAQYCIAEMVYFNLPEWRNHNCEQRIIEHMKKHGDIYGSKDQGVLCTQFIGEYAQLPLKYNIYGMTYFFTSHNRKAFNNAPVISKEELEEAYKNPEIIHLPRTFLYRPCEEGSMDRLYDMWWDYCNRSPWRHMTPLNPYPPLTVPEKVFRWLFKWCPKPIAEWLYVNGRHWAWNLEWIISMVKSDKYRITNEK